MKEALFFRYHDKNGEISIAKDLYHIHHKTACVHLPSFKQVFLDLPLLQFSYSKRSLTIQKKKKENRVKSIQI